MRQVHECLGMPDLTLAYRTPFAAMMMWLLFDAYGNEVKEWLTAPRSGSAGERTEAWYMVNAEQRRMDTV